MAAVPVTSLGLPRGRPLTVDDLAAMPDDGHRYELLDGTLLVSPSPGWSHQEVVGALYRLLYAHRAAGLRVVVAPFAVGLGSATEVQPDLLVARYDDLRHGRLTGVPLLVVEVLSASTSLVDRTAKRAAYERAGVASYWLVDPDEPSLTVLRLRPEGRYDEVDGGMGSAAVTVEDPFPLTIVPALLRADLEPD